MNMTSNYDVTNKAHQILMTTICTNDYHMPLSEIPPWKFSAYVTVSDCKKSQKCLQVFSTNQTWLFAININKTPQMPCCDWKLATCLTCRIAVSVYTHKYGMILAHRLVAHGADLFGLPVSARRANPAPLVLWQLFGSWRYWNDRKLRKCHFHSFSDAQWNCGCAILVSAHGRIISSASAFMNLRRVCAFFPWFTMWLWYRIEALTPAAFTIP